MLQIAGLALALFAGVWYVLARVAPCRALHHGPLLPAGDNRSWCIATALVIGAAAVAAAM